MTKPGIKRPLVIKTSPRFVPVTHIRINMTTAYKFVIPHLQTVSQSEKCLFCHSEFISESHVFSMLQATEILKRVQDDNCDRVC
jgi:hypothetical protein